MTQKFLGSILIGLLAFLNNNVYAQSNIVPPKVEIPNSQVLTLTSSAVGQEYKLYINLPGSYGQDTTKAYPVVYLLDGQWDFALLTSIYGSQYYDGFLPEFITVGITWGGKETDFSSLRERDFTPTRIADKPQSGGGPIFLEFIKKELIPFVDTRYRTTNDRTLIGSSLGGLFTLYTLFYDPSLFHRYVLTSPSLWWDNSVLRTYAKKYEEDKSSSPVRLFMGVGGLETDVSDFQKFADSLRAKKSKGLKLQTLVMENTGHSGSAAEGFTRGLQSVFERPSLQLAAAILDRYAGTYQIGPITIYLSKDKGKLIAVTPENKFVLHAETEKDFYVKGAFMNVHFKTDDAGKISGFQLDQFEGGVFVKKIK